MPNTCCILRDEGNPALYKLSKSKEGRRLAQGRFARIEIPESAGASSAMIANLAFVLRPVRIFPSSAAICVLAYAAVLARPPQVEAQHPGDDGKAYPARKAATDSPHPYFRRFLRATGDRPIRKQNSYSKVPATSLILNAAGLCSRCPNGEILRETTESRTLA